MWLLPSLFEYFVGDRLIFRSADYNDEERPFEESYIKKNRSVVTNHRNIKTLPTNLIINKNNFSNDTVVSSNNVGANLCSKTVFLLPLLKFVNC